MKEQEEHVCRDCGEEMEQDSSERFCVYCVDSEVY